MVESLQLPARRALSPPNQPLPVLELSELLLPQERAIHVYHNAADENSHRLSQSVRKATHLIHKSWTGICLRFTGPSS